jgi:CBS domain-containing protein
MRIVRDVMSQMVISVGPETPLKEVAELLVERKISGVPVVDARGGVLGVVSEADFLLKEQGPEAIRHRRLAGLFGESDEARAQMAKLRAATAADAMTGPAVTIESSRPIAEAARLMTAKAVNRLPVVDDGRLVGIVTRADLVRAYVRSDRELVETIRTEVLLRSLWLDPAAFEIDVEDGVVRISGRVERRSTAEMVARTIAMVPGVVGIQSDIPWSIDDNQIRPVERDPVFPFGPH